MHVAWKICILGAISLNKIFIKICSHPIISWFFVTPPYFSWKNSVTPQLFHDPPHSEENDSPLKTQQTSERTRNIDNAIQPFSFGLFLAQSSAGKSRPCSRGNMSKRGCFNMAEICWLLGDVLLLHKDVFSKTTATLCTSNCSPYLQIWNI